MPDFLVSDERGQTLNVGPVRIGVMRGGLTFEQIGSNILNAGHDPGRTLEMSPQGVVVRFMGQIWTHTGNLAGTSQLAVRVYDEGGIDDWPVILFDADGPGTTKGGQGKSWLASWQTSRAMIVELLTEDRVYIVAAYNVWNSHHGWWYVGADTGQVTRVEDFVQPGTWGTSGETLMGIAHDGLTYWLGGSSSLSKIVSFDPVTDLRVYYLNASNEFGYSGGATQTNQRSGQFFTLHDRLFVATMMRQAKTGENTYISRVVEFAFGNWTESPGVNTFLGDGGSMGGRFAVFKISPTKVMLIGHGSEDDPNGGLIAIVLTTVGDAADGALQSVTIAPTNAVIPLALRPTGGSYGGNGAALESARCYGTTVTDDPSGTIRHFMYFVTDGSVVVTVPSLYEVFDDATPMVLVPQTPQMDSNFAFPGALYGGGNQSGGVDGSTRYVSVQARGWTKGNQGVRVKISAHGDATVLAYHNGSGAFTPGETIQGQTSSAEGILIGDGASQGLHLRNVVNGPFEGDEQVLGLTSSETADLNLVLRHSGAIGSLFELGETVTDGGTGATGIIRQLGLGGPGEQLIKVEWTSSPTAFGNGNVITGSANATTATLANPQLGQHGGAADKTIRARFFGGKGVPSAFATMVEFTGIGGIVSKGTGPGGSDEFINVIADGAPGDTPISFEWDFLLDGVNPNSVAQMLFEIDRI